jgi:hypothetical protein
VLLRSAHLSAITDTVAALGAFWPITLAIVLPGAAVLWLQGRPTARLPGATLPTAATLALLVWGSLFPDRGGGVWLTVPLLLYLAHVLAVGWLAWRYRAGRGSWLVVLLPQLYLGALAGWSTALAVSGALL